MNTNWKKYEKMLPVVDVKEDGSVYGRSVQNINGYKSVFVRQQGKQYNLLLHILVALKYIERPEEWTEEWEVNHKNGVKTDCRAENLEWVTRSENIRHAFRNGLIKKDKEKKPVQQLDCHTGEAIGVYDSIRDAEKATGVSHTTISRCCNGRYKTSGGYKWCFV